MKKKTKNSIALRIIITVVSAVGIALIFYLLLSYLVFQKISFNWDNLVINGFNIVPILIIFFIVMLSILIGCLLALVLSKGMYQPLNLLKTSMIKISKGEYKKLEAPKDADDELKELFSAYNKMINDLNSMENMSKDFVANVSHEFKSPLATIKGYASLLKEKNLTEEEKKSYLDFIIEASQNLSNMTGNILSISKIENQEIIKKISFNLAEQIRQIILIFENKITEKNLELDLEIDEINYYSNKEFTQIIFQNLINNAVKFTDKGTIKITLEETNENILFTITDSGCGMNKTTIENLFNKFYQGETSHKVQGNGLGLALVKTITEKLGGTIKVESKEKQGTTFFVNLPKESNK